MSDPTIAIGQINLCISDLKTWMIKYKPKINDSKVEFIVLTSSFLNQQFNDLLIRAGKNQIDPSTAARNIGVMFDSHLISHTNYICKSAHFHLTNIHSVRNMLADDTSRSSCEAMLYKVTLSAFCGGFVTCASLISSLKLGYIDYDTRFFKYHILLNNQLRI